MTQKEAKLWLRVKWPVTIINDRYRGCYSGAEWTAFPLEPFEIPEEVIGEDIECSEFWEQNKEPVGKGLYADDALDELEYLIREIAKGN